ncbi:ACP S-malonyltransferase [bacterium]|nr:ACP S-malonyltransferase [bacterium]
MKGLFLYPGQGAQKPGMADAFHGNPQAWERLLIADEVLGFSLSALVTKGPADELTLTANAQPALLAVGMAFHDLWTSAGLEPVAAAGHSLGEYTALCAAGSFLYEDALHLVRVRGQAMQEAVPNGEGGMVALLGKGDVEALLGEASEDGCLVAANLNTPVQTVLSGDAQSIQRATSVAPSFGFRRAVPLSVSAPFHSPLMQPVAERMADALSGVEITPPQWPVASNATGGWHAQEPDEIRRCLVDQIVGAVQWVQNMETVATQPGDVWLDVGPGKVVAGMAPREDSRPKCHLEAPPLAVGFLE